MTLVPLSALFVFACVAMPLQAEAAESRNAALIAKGQVLVQTQCKTCHAIGLTDNSPLDRAPPLRRIAERYPIDHLAEAFAEGIVVRHSEMPQFEFQPPEIEALLAYLTSLGQSGARRR